MYAPVMPTPIRIMHPMVTGSLVASLALGACGGDDASSSASGGSAATGGNASTAMGGTGPGGTGGAGGGGTGGMGTGGTGAGLPIGSDGCGTAAADPTEQWVMKTISVGGTTREFFVYLPPSYDSDSPYPVVYQFHGCSSNPNKENNNPPVQEQSGAAAIHIRGRAVDDCWDNSANGSDVQFFDALVAEVEASWCADVDRRFATGYSSGAFMTHRLSCERGDMLRGVASIAGGLAGNNCVGRTAALIIHDDTDQTVNISASEQARDRHLANNACGASATPTDPAPCTIYDGCDAGFDVVWCQTTGQGHSRQDGLSAPAFWDFLSQL
jgi:poly(3-hydroxybutyrate) depolymerase